MKKLAPREILHNEVMFILSLKSVGIANDEGMPEFREQVSFTFIFVKIYAYIQLISTYISDHAML